MKPNDLDTWNLAFYQQRRGCCHKDECSESADIKDRELFMPLPPKIVGTIPRIIVLAMEPSGDWAKNNTEAEKQIEEGERCFSFQNHLGNLTLHYSIQEALVCWHGERCRFDYYITNLGKCAMAVGKAKKNPEKRYELCLDYVKEEIQHVLYHNDVIQPVVFAMGKKPYNWLVWKGKEDLRITLPHKYPVVSLFPEGGYLLHNSRKHLPSNLKGYWENHGVRPEGKGFEKSRKLQEAKLRDFAQKESIQSISKRAKLDMYAELAMVYHQQLAEAIRAHDPQFNSRLSQPC